MTFEQKIKAKLTITFCKVPFLVTRIIVMIYVQFKVYSRFIYFPNASYVFFKPSKLESRMFKRRSNGFS